MHYYLHVLLLHKLAGQKRQNAMTKKKKTTNIRQKKKTTTNEIVACFVKLLYTQMTEKYEII